MGPVFEDNNRSNYDIKNSKCISIGSSSASNNNRSCNSNPHQRGQGQSRGQNVDGLRELLQDPAPDESHGPEQDHDHAGQVLGALLAVEVLRTQEE